MDTNTNTNNSKIKKPRIFNMELLNDKIKKDGATLVGKYDDLCKKSKITFICKCKEKNTKNILVILDKGGAICKKCTNAKMLDNMKKTNSFHSCELRSRMQSMHKGFILCSNSFGVSLRSVRVAHKKMNLIPNIDIKRYQYYKIIMLSKEEYKKKQIDKYYRNKYKEKKTIEKYLNNRNDDIINKIIDNLSRRAYKFFRDKNIDRKTTHLELIGCDKECLKDHLEKQFIDNMSYENYGEWEVDHIFPISKCNIEKMDEIMKIFNYKNLRPLWQTENRKKYNKNIENVSNAN
jgi:hypothetical protein